MTPTPHKPTTPSSTTPAQYPHPIRTPYDRSCFKGRVNTYGLEETLEHYRKMDARDAANGNAKFQTAEEVAYEARIAALDKQKKDIERRSAQWVRSSMR
jgi:hypothetical protein